MKRVQLESMILPSRVTAFTVTDDIPFVEHTTCEACTNTLDILSTLSSLQTKKSIRVGICDACGYIGYIDRPAKEWMVNFYSKEWDKTFTRTVEDVRTNYSFQKGIIRGSMETAFRMHEKLSPDMTRPVLEVGSGYGQVLKHLSNAGYTKVFGIENSTVRAERVTEAFGFKIFKGDFGSKEMTETLKSYGPFSLIFSHHVFEHTYNPRQVVEAISALQNEGDALILAMPNGFTEHSMYQTMYVPHLHSFTPESLETLLNQFGYQVRMCNTEHATSVILGAIKKSNPEPTLSKKEHYAKAGIDRLSDALKVTQVAEGDLYELYWEQKPEDTNYSSFSLVHIPRIFFMIAWTVRTWYWHIKTRAFKRFRSGYFFRMKRLPDGEKDGVEIVCSEALRVMMK